MTSHTAPMAPATPFFLLSEYQTPTILSSKSFRLLFPGNQGHKSPPSPVGADDSAARPLVPRRPATTQCRRQNYQAINALVPKKAGTPKSPQAPRPTPSPHPSSPVPPQGDDLHPPSHSGKVSKGRAAALPLVVSRGSGGKFEIPPEFFLRGSGGVFFQFGKNTSPDAAKHPWHPPAGRPLPQLPTAPNYAIVSL